MKRLFALLIAAVLLLTGCARFRPAFNDPANFYYRRAEFDYTGSEPVIVSEQREVTGHRNDPNYLISLYLLGPLDGNLVSPFPAGVKLLSTTRNETMLIIELSTTDRSLSDLRFSLACTCLAKTFMELGDYASVTVVSGSRSLTTTRDNILLTDELPPERKETQP